MPFPSSHPSLERALADRGYAEPTPVQAAVLQPEAAGRDLLVSAQTGSGKTVAYGLAFAPTLLGAEERLGPPDEPLGLVIAPTRELALQVQRELIWLYGPAGARVASCVGGMDVRREARALADGCHLVVGTPGRLRDHLERGRLDTSKLRVAVLDEADEMLDLGFREDLEFILDATPAERRTLLFSATIPREIATLAKRYQRDALRIDTVDQRRPHADIEYRAVRIAPNEVELAVVNVLRFFEVSGALVFCHTREAVRHLHTSLVERGFSAVALSGELTQSERSHALQALRDGRARVCVATDVAARGIDLPNLGLVIHADLPNDRETLLHRSGRTGRAGRKGICILLVPYTRFRKAERLLSHAGLAAEWGPAPGAEDIRAADQRRLVADPAFAEETTDEDLALVRAVMAERSPEEIAAALVRLYRARLPAPEDLVDAGAAPAREGRGPRDAREPRPTERDQPSEGMVSFRMSVGRRNNADPRWLVPIICRLGHVTKKDIGRIRIFDRETKFEIAEPVAGRFAASVRRSTPNDEDIRIEPAGTPDHGARHDRKPPGPTSVPHTDGGRPSRGRSRDEGSLGPENQAGPNSPHRRDGKPGRGSKKDRSPQGAGSRKAGRAPKFKERRRSTD